jgi:hypothetical protein
VEVKWRGESGGVASGEEKVYFVVRRVEELERVG